MFDLLADDSGSLVERPFSERREALKAFVKAAGQQIIVLSKATRSATTARKWLSEVGKGLDGIVAKRLDQPYRPGERTMRKFKVWHTVDAVLAGYYEDEATGGIDSLLFGLYDEEGWSPALRRPFASLRRCWRDREVLEQAQDGRGGFTGRSPGGKSRWTGKAQKMIRLKPVLVAELSADHISGGQFRHGSRLLRWRTDKAPDDCRMEHMR